MENIKEEVLVWLKSFAQMVRNEDYTDAEKYFDKITFGFGTIAEQYSNLSEYRTLQWNWCWSTTKSFDFVYSSLNLASSPDGGMVVAGVLWTSVGVHKDGSEFPREGRATIVLKRDSETGALKNVHSHYSRTPKNFPEDF